MPRSVNAIAILPSNVCARLVFIDETIASKSRANEGPLTDRTRKSG
jgi:hypothetical protein